MYDDIFLRNRSCRRFDESVPVPDDALCRMADAARLSASAGNLQRLRFLAVRDGAGCAAVFSALTFAAYLPAWDGPAPGERPTAYLVLTSDAVPDGNLMTDVGIAAEAILLCARMQGFAGCMFRSFSPPVLREALPDMRGEPLLVIALGFPAERAEVEERTDTVKYYRRSDGTHVVPKRPLSDVLAFHR